MTAPAANAVLAPRRPARWRRAVGTLFAPVRFAFRRPGRALLYAVAFVVAVAALGAGAAALWFRHHLNAARVEVERGHNAAATRHLQQCQRLLPEDPDVLLLAARVARRSGAWDEAGALLDRYWELKGDDARVVFERLLLRATRGEVESAAPLLSARIAAGGPDSRLAYEALITGLLYRFRWVEAEGLIQNWLGHSPDDTIALLMRGKLQDQRSLTPEAVRTFRRVLELDPEHDEARLRLCGLLLQIRQGEEALPHLTYLRRRLPENAEVRVQLARALALQGRTDEARAALDELLRDRPDLPAALDERGRIAVADGDDKAAEDYLRRAVRFDPGNIAARNQYAEVLTRNGKVAEAAKERDLIQKLQADLERINQVISGPLQMNPTDPALHHEIGMIALRSGQPNEAMRWLKSALEVDPNHLPTHQVLVMFYRETGNPILAAKHRAIAQRLAGQKQP